VIDRRIKPGAFVVHPPHPEWGLGRVAHVECGKVFVFFRHRLAREAKRIDWTSSPVEFAPIQTESMLDLLPPPYRPEPTSRTVTLVAFAARGGVYE
jgi:hypothetical protein